MNQCIFGGSFDPPHEGHRHLARSAVAALDLDRLFWVPTQVPPHKESPTTPFRDRVEMVRLAIDGMPGNEVSDIEDGLPKPTYSLYSVRALKARFDHPGDRWYFLVGADNWAIFPKWYRPEELLREVTLVVYPRAGADIGPLPQGVQALPLDLVPGRSSAIRAALAQGASPESAGLLPEIRRYVAAHGLYGSRSGS